MGCKNIYRCDCVMVWCPHTFDNEVYIYEACAFLHDAFKLSGQDQGALND